MESNQDTLSESHDLIKSASDEQYSNFESHIEMTKMEDLAAIADRLGCAEQSTWRDYCKAFCDYEWYQFIDAYYRVTYKNYE